MVIWLCKKQVELYLSDIYSKFTRKHSHRKHEKLCYHNPQSHHPLEQSVKTQSHQPLEQSVKTQSHQPLEQSVNTNPFIFPIFNKSDKIPAEDDSVNKDACDRDSQLYNTVPYNYSENMDYSDSHDLIVWEFMRYYSDRFLNVRTIGKVAHLLIGQSKMAKKLDSNYYAAFFTLIDILEVREEITGGSLLNELAHRFVKVAKKDGNSFWDMTTIVFTLAHEFLQRYPYQFLEIKEMLLQFLGQSSDDIERLGGWTNFEHYCSNMNIVKV